MMLQQLPSTQKAWKKSQAWPHAPQFSGSVVTLTQIPPQLWKPFTQHWSPAL